MFFSQSFWVGKRSSEHNTFPVVQFPLHIAVKCLPGLFLSSTGNEELESVHFIFQQYWTYDNSFLLWIRNMYCVVSSHWCELVLEMYKDSYYFLPDTFHDNNLFSFTVKHPCELSRNCINFHSHLTDQKTETQRW